MEKLKLLLLVLGLLVATLNCKAQTSWNTNGERVPKNALKLDLFGPAPMIRASLRIRGLGLEFFWWRFLMRYEHKFDRFKHFSFVADAEYRNRPVQYGVPNGTLVGYGSEYQKGFSLYAGPRIFGILVHSEKFDLFGFGELRLGVTWRRAQLYEGPDGVDIGIRNRLGIVPKLRAGVGCTVVKRLGVELSGDLGRYRVVGDGRHFWELLPEVSFVVWF